MCAQPAIFLARGQFADHLNSFLGTPHPSWGGLLPTKCSIKFDLSKRFLNGMTLDNITPIIKGKVLWNF